MGQHADDAREEEEHWNNLRASHKAKQCGGEPYCPFCTPGWEPLFEFQSFPEED